MGMVQDYSPRSVLLQRVRHIRLLVRLTVEVDHLEVSQVFVLVHTGRPQEISPVPPPSHSGHTPGPPARPGRAERPQGLLVPVLALTGTSHDYQDLCRDSVWSSGGQFVAIKLSSLHSV